METSASFEPRSAPSLYPTRPWYFAVTAYDTSGNESAFSNEVSKTIE